MNTTTKGTKEQVQTYTLKAGETCEACNEPVPANTIAYAYAIGGGWALSCAECKASHDADLTAGDFQADETIRFHKVITRNVGQPAVNINAERTRSIVITVTLTEKQAREYWTREEGMDDRDFPTDEWRLGKGTDDILASAAKALIDTAIEGTYLDGETRTAHVETSIGNAAFHVDQQ